MKFCICGFVENLLRKFKFHYSLTSITGILHEDQYTFSNISSSVLLRMRNVSDIACRGNPNTHFVFSNILLFFFENRTVYEIMWKNIVQSDRPQMTIWGRCIVCWILKATDTQSGYVIILCFSTETMVMGKRLHVTSYVQCLSS